MCVLRGLIHSESESEARLPLILSASVPLLPTPREGNIIHQKAAHKFGESLVRDFPYFRENKKVLGKEITQRPGKKQEAFFKSTLMIKRFGSQTLGKVFSNLPRQADSHLSRLPFSLTKNIQSESDSFLYLSFFCSWGPFIMVMR